MHLKQQLDIRHDIGSPIAHHQSSLPTLANTACMKKDLDMIGPHFKSAMASFNINLIFTDHWNVEVDKFEYCFDYYPRCVTLVFDLKTI